ncbi:heterogeneous nuclear ribonucleoprotein L-like isoform X1 [Hydractinia symbiolongicarpus]|uniref:heterogeneous nuclear ribonucleoprotein L-like isoform X1 n=1 Tax=Hydractinia symbiolongicarpus TaxID=13093 RepID=UPI002549D495|nr:heterogeneous nuclear ribonucleoprotein L-like isoform X1 [Hydractinia symbiolongicarpus]
MTTATVLQSRLLLEPDQLITSCTKSEPFKNSENLASVNSSTIYTQAASDQSEISLAAQLVDPARAVQIVTKAIQLATNPLQLSDTINRSYLNSKQPISGAQYQRKLKMEELYKWRVWTPYPVQMVKPKVNGKGYDNHNMPPSKVIHCRAVADGCKETDLVQVMRPFGSIRALTLMPKLRQALVEYEELESAIACVTYAQLQPVLVLGRQMYVNYSKSTEINRDFSNSASIGQTPTNILLFTIINAIHPVNVETVKKICLQHAEVQRIVIFHKNGLQALVEFLTIDDAQRVQQALNGCDIFAGCCTLKIDFSKTGRLNVHANTAETYDVEIEKRKRGGSLLALMNHTVDSNVFAQSQVFSQAASDAFNTTKSPSNLGLENGKLSQEAISAILAGAAGFPAVQSLIAKVMTSGSQAQAQSSQPIQASSSGIGTLLTNTMDTSVDSDSGSSMSSVSRTTLLSAQPTTVETYTSPFAALSGGLSLAGGEGCVAMVYGVNNEKMNCDHLFNLFCLYGNVVKVKTLVNKPGAAMIQYTDKMSTDISIRNLNNLTLFGQKFQLSFSKHPFIADASQVTPLFDGSASAVSYADSRNNRFKFIPGGVDIFSRIHPPSKVLHYFNAPPDCTEEQLKQVFETLGAEVPTKQATFSKSNGKSSSGLLEFSSVPTAVEALILANHFTMHRDNSTDPFHMIEQGGAAYTLKLAFSPSNAINN